MSGDPKVWAIQHLKDFAEKVKNLEGVQVVNEWDHSTDPELKQIILGLSVEGAPLSLMVWITP